MAQVEKQRLIGIAQPMRTGQPRQAVADEIILTLCRGQFLTANQLGELLDRNPNALRSGYLTRLAAENRLELRHPTKTRSRHQAYRTREVR